MISCIFFNWWKYLKNAVAPFMGAWIEISKITDGKNLKSKSHPLWVRGLKFFKSKSSAMEPASRTLYGCVDWNHIIDNNNAHTIGRTLYGCVDWNKQSKELCNGFWSRTLYGCVDWNKKNTSNVWENNMSHPLWVRGLK